MKRHNQILAAVLVVQIILSVVVFWPRSAALAEREPLFPDLEVDDIVALTITGGATSPDARSMSAPSTSEGEDKSITLQQVEEDWILPDADDYPAQANKVTSLLEKIVGLETGRLVTRTDASHKRLQVASDDFARRIDFETAGGETHTLYLGSSPSYGAIHFRVEGQSEVYLASDINTYETGAAAASWVDPTYLNVPQGDVTAVTLENENGQFTFVKDDAGEEGGGNWTMEGLGADETLDEGRVDALLRQAALVNMIEPLGKEDQPEYGMHEPGAVVTLSTEEKTVTLRVGAKDPDDNSYVVTSSESPYYVRVAEYNVKELVENAREDFLQQEPTPTPEANADES